LPVLAFSGPSANRIDETRIEELEWATTELSGERTTMAKVPSWNATHRILVRACAVSIAILAARGGIGGAQPAPLLESAGSTSRPREATIGIIPQTSRVCPGRSFGAKYVEHFPDGSQVVLPPSDVKQIVSSDDESATMLRDGSWQTNADPMRSVLSGFHLSASLARDASVRGDTVVAPAYDCPRAEIRLPTSDGSHTIQAYVRLGVFATPFYDSVVVAVVEVGSRPFAIAILPPAEMRNGAIKVSAPGKNGTPGRKGQTGLAGTDCSNGEQGEDGEPGEPGQPGGQVDMIVQEGSPWLADLVAVVNPGGRGGQGGAGGDGGLASSGGSGGRGATCRPRPGRQGRPGQTGQDGTPGRPPNVTSVLVPLLWTGSPIWSQPPARRAIEGLLAREQKRGG
jgi:hypothetical protein